MNNLQHVGLIEIELSYGSPLSPAQEKVVLFNKANISEAEALRFAASDEYNPNVLCISKKQWETLFLHKGV